MELPKQRRQCMTSTFVVLFCIIFAESYEVSKIGNDVIPSAGGPDVTGGSAIFLLKDAFPEAGVLFAFSAFFRNRNPLQFQVWRPSSNSSYNFTLLAELRVTPSVAESAELVYIVSQLTEKCVRVATGDRLGLHFANASSPLAQTFNRFDANPQILVHYVDGPPPTINLNDTLEFDVRIYPYDFSLTAFYYLENSNLTEDAPSAVDCPKNQLIDGDPKPSTPSTPVPTGIPGPIGAVGRSGLIGLAGDTGPAGSVGQTGATGNVGLSGSTGIAGYAGATGQMGSTGVDGATGRTGPNGSIGATGSAGPGGLVGEIGLPGVLLYTNETDFNDTLGLAPQQVLSSSDRQWKSEAYMQGILIWLAIVSLILIVIFVVLGLFTAHYRSLRRVIEDVSRRMNLFGMSNTLTTELPNITTNHGTVKSQRALGIDEDLRDMREETFTNYEVDTMEKYATKKLKDLNAYDEN